MVTFAVVCYEWHMTLHASGPLRAASQVATGALAAAILIVVLVPGNDMRRALAGYVAGSLLGGLIARNRLIVFVLPIVVLGGMLAYVQTGCSDCSGGNEPLPKAYTYVASAIALVAAGGLAALGVMLGHRLEAFAAEQSGTRVSSLFGSPVWLIVPSGAVGWWSGRSRRAAASEQRAAGRGRQFGRGRPAPLLGAAVGWTSRPGHDHR